ncbi:MAG TPA: NAD(P)-binding domain-containing protein, partial [Draconibacterium sp.]|nr:NAD(P)-binding domain-containing protein [Draconibacterium sp.]
MKTAIGFIGGGRITKIFLQGFKNADFEPESVQVYEPNAETFEKLASIFPAVEKAETAETAASQAIVFIAVHPPVVMETLQKIKNAVTESTIVVSLAPKITLEKMASVLPAKKLARMIPNATSFINKGFNPVAFSAGFEGKEKKQLLKFLKILGKTFETEETKLEGYAIVSAMLPTYFWFQWQEMENIAIETGLSEKEAKKAVNQTLKKALKLYYDTSLTPAEVMDLIPVKPI